MTRSIMTSQIDNSKLDTYSYIIVSEIDNMIVEDMQEMLTRIARKKKNRKWVRNTGDGTSIRLDKLPAEVIVDIYNFMKLKLDLDDI